MNYRGRLIGADQIIQFMQAGNSTLTLVSAKTGTRFTYKIKLAEPKDGEEQQDLWFVAMLNGPDNETDYQYLGLMRDGVYHHGRKSRVGIDAPGVVAFSWFHRQISKSVVPAQLEVWHEGRCGRCGRTLTVPSSVASGFGPECIQYVGGVHSDNPLTTILQEHDEHEKPRLDRTATRHARAGRVARTPKQSRQRSAGRATAQQSSR